MSKPDSTPVTADFDASGFPPETMAIIAQLQAREEAYQAELSRSQAELTRSQAELSRIQSDTVRLQNERTQLTSERDQLKAALAELWEQVRLLTHKRWMPSSEKDIPDAQARLFDEPEQLDKG